jgi:hypothetical protein
VLFRPATGTEVLRMLMPCRSRFAAVFPVSLLAMALAVAACNTNSTPAARACCEQPEIPAGVAPFTVVVDEANGPSDGQKVILRVALGKPTKRDDIYPVLHTLYRHAMKRGPFEPIQFIADVYPSEAAAKSAGDTQLLARISRQQSQIAPVCENRVGYDFGEQVDRAFASSLGRGTEEKMEDTCRLDPAKVKPRFDDGFKHKPTFQMDQAQKAVAVTYPYLEMGKDEYVPELKLTTALVYWIEHVTTLFRNVPDLKAVTFTGLHNDAEVLRIAVNRQQFDSQFAGLQETIAAHSAITFASLGMGKATDKGAEKEQEDFKLKTYRGALAELPKGQVTIVKDLADGKMGKAPAAEKPAKGKKARRS